jgi:hypothetical protein
MSHNHYFRDVSHLEQIDVYRVLKLFGVECPVAQHVVKKALAAGQRGHKSVRRDWQDIADSATRRLQMMDEELAAANKAFCVPGEQGPCTCPGGDGSLRWPCPAHAIAPEFGQQNTIDYRAPEEKAELA